MKTKILTLIAVAVTALIMMPGDSVAQSGATFATTPGVVTGSVANGRDLFYRHTCYGCHGYNGETGARDLVGTNSPILATEANFVSFLRARADQAPLLPSTRMPNYPEAAVSNRDARDLYAFIKTFRKDAPAIEDVPTLEKILESAERPYQP